MSYTVERGEQITTLDQARNAQALSVMHVVGSLQSGGAERWVRELAPRINARGLRTEIVTVYSPNLTSVELESLGCAVHHRRKRSGFDPMHSLWLSLLIGRRRPAIVHTHQWAGKYVGRLAAAAASVPILVHTEHSPNPVEGLEKILTQLFWRRTAATIAFSQENAEVIDRREPVKHFEIIRNGLVVSAVPSSEDRVEARRRLGIVGDTVAIGITASLQERKNHRLAFEAFSQIAEKPERPIRLLLFGEGPLRAQLELVAAQLGISERVNFYGFRSDVRELLPGLDVLLSVALREMAPISVLEGMAAGLPIIAAPHQGTQDMVIPDLTGMIVDWNRDQIANAIRRARDDKDWRQRCGLAGRVRVERNHDIEDIADQHVSLYERLLRACDARL